MPRPALALKAIGCYLLGLLLGVPLVMAVLAAWNSKISDSIFVLMYWMLGGIVSLPFFVALLTIMLVFADNLLAYLERWCLVMPFAVALAMPCTAFVMFLIATGQWPTLQEIERDGIELAGLWVFGAFLTFPCAAISSALFYFSVRRSSTACLTESPETGKIA